MSDHGTVGIAVYLITAKTGKGICMHAQSLEKMKPVSLSKIICASLDIIVLFNMEYRQSDL